MPSTSSSARAPAAARVAARLAEAGFSVLLLEAGGDPRTLAGGDPQTPGGNSLPDDYDVPAFHALATENDAMRWDFFVRHYADAGAAAAGSEVLRDLRRASRWTACCIRAPATLGGCTAHNAMILVYPHNADWNQIADLTGDRSWRAEHMRTLFRAARELPPSSDGAAVSASSA